MAPMTDVLPSKLAPSQLGPCLMAARKARGVTLKQLAERSGISISSLSKVENGLMSLTYDKLLQVANGLGIEITELFYTPQADTLAAQRPLVTGRRSLARQGSGQVVEADAYTYKFRCTDLVGKRMVPFLVEVRARSLDEFGPLLKHAGEEYIQVLDGRIEVHTEFYAPEILEAGDGIYLDSNMGHAYLNAGDAPAQCLCVCTAEDHDTVETLRQSVTRTAAL